jgi:lysophospholipid acyltransferase (LPLAT)-like uncharacterized protein
MLRFGKEKWLPTLIVWLIGFWSALQRLTFHGEDAVAAVQAQGKPIIFVFWHGRQFVLLNSHRNRGICIMTSLSRDGDLQTRILTKLGYCTVRGSSSRGGAKALVGMMRAIKAGHDVAFAGDGPRGPLYAVKPGPFYLAQKTGAAVIPVAISASRAWHLSNWDRYAIPKPFSRTCVAYGEAVFVDESCSVEEAQQAFNVTLNALQEKLDQQV